ncbi:MAG: hypothetical protein R6V67_05305 [Spirochaetia bacterium]
MKNRHTVCLIVGGLFFIGLSTISAQSNEVVDRLLDQERVTYGYSAYMVLTSLGTISDDASVEEAAEALPAEEWNLTSRPAGDPITLGEYSHMLMRAFDINGGIMYTIFSGPRYAARELKYLQCIPGSSAPGRSIDGHEVVQILGRLLQWKEDRS